MPVAQSKFMKPDTRQLCGSADYTPWEWFSFVMRSQWSCGFLFRSLQNNACNNFIGTEIPATSVFFQYGSIFYRLKPAYTDLTESLALTVNVDRVSPLSVVGD